MTPEIAKALNELVITLLGLVTTVVVPWLFSLVRAYAKAWVEAIQNKETRAALEFALDRLDATAQTVVTEINQTSKTLTEDGKLSKEDALTLLKKSYSRLMARLPADATATLQVAYGERLQGVIVGKIESKVAGAKLCAG